MCKCYEKLHVFPCPNKQHSVLTLATLWIPEFRGNLKSSKLSRKSIKSDSQRWVPDEHLPHLMVGGTVCRLGMRVVAMAGVQNTRVRMSCRRKMLPRWWLRPKVFPMAAAYMMGNNYVSNKHKHFVTWGLVNAFRTHKTVSKWNKLLIVQNIIFYFKIVIITWKMSQVLMNKWD